MKRPFSGRKANEPNNLLTLLSGHPNNKNMYATVCHMGRAHTNTSSLGIEPQFCVKKVAQSKAEFCD